MTAGLLPPNDVHPTEKGQRLLADTVESVVSAEEYLTFALPHELRRDRHVAATR